MTVAGAIALTGLAFMLVAAVVATHASEATWETKKSEVRIAWGSFAVAMVLFIVAVWVEVL